MVELGEQAAVALPALNLLPDLPLVTHFTLVTHFILVTHFTFAHFWLPAQHPGLLLGQAF